MVSLNLKICSTYLYIFYFNLQCLTIHLSLDITCIRSYNDIDETQIIQQDI